MKKFITVLAVIIGVVFVILVFGPFYTVHEGEQVVVVRFGRIVQVQIDAGLKVKTPLLDRVRRYPKKILSWDGEAQRLPTEENQFIWVDNTARWRISDPEKFYESVGTITQAQSRLDDVIDSEVRKIISRNSLREAVRNSNIINEIERRDVYLSPAAEGETEDLSVSIAIFSETIYEEIQKGRSVLSDEMLVEARRTTPQYGIDLIDVVIRQIKYSDDLTESVYKRMIKERNQFAQAFRSDGEGKKVAWIGQMERERLSIQSNAYKTSESIKGEADAAAAAIYANAYNQDPEFYKFWKSLESYRMLIPRFDKTMTTDPEYFDYLYDQRGKR